MSKKEHFKNKFNANLSKQTEKHNKLLKRHIVKQNWPKLNYSKLIKLQENNFKKNKNSYSKDSNKVKIKLLNLKNIKKRRRKKLKKESLMIILTMNQNLMSIKSKPNKKK